MYKKMIDEKNDITDTSLESRCRIERSEREKMLMFILKMLIFYILIFIVTVLMYGILYGKDTLQLEDVLCCFVLSLAIEMSVDLVIFLSIEEKRG